MSQDCSHQQYDVICARVQTRVKVQGGYRVYINVDLSTFDTRIMFELVYILSCRFDHVGLTTFSSSKVLKPYFSNYVFA